MAAQTGSTGGTGSKGSTGATATGTSKTDGIEYKVLTDVDRAQMLASALAQTEKAYFQAELQHRIADSLGDNAAKVKFKQHLGQLKETHRMILEESSGLPAVPPRPVRPERPERPERLTPMERLAQRDTRTRTGRSI